LWCVCVVLLPYSHPLGTIRCAGGDTSDNQKVRKRTAGGCTFSRGPIPPVRIPASKRSHRPLLTSTILPHRQARPAVRASR
jgi:hypothetical protein